MMKDDQTYHQWNYRIESNAEKPCLNPFLNPAKYTKPDITRLHRDRKGMKLRL